MILSGGIFIHIITHLTIIHFITDLIIIGVGTAAVIMDGMIIIHIMEVLMHSVKRNRELIGIQA
jgi:imidazoleglycerol phosphate synthase glutamine amidotransferase subunit HisH